MIRVALAPACLTLALSAACGTTPVATPPPAPAQEDVAGVGLWLSLRGKDGQPDSVPWIEKLVLDGAAASVGVRRGEYVWAVDGTPVVGLALADVTTRLRGPAGTKVSLKVGEALATAREVTATRAPLPPDVLRCREGDCQSGTGHADDIWGMVYDGQFADGTFDGQGKVTMPDGTTYEGGFSKGAATGAGATVIEGDRFEGTYEAGYPVGTCKIYLHNGDLYEGETKAFKMEGKGRYERPADGDVWEGTYANGFLVEGTWLHHPAQGDGRTCLRKVTGGEVDKTGTITYAKGDKKKREVFTGAFGDDCVANGDGVMRYVNKKAQLRGTFAADEPKPGAKWGD